MHLANTGHVTVILLAPCGLFDRMLGHAAKISSDSLSEEEEEEIQYVH